MAASTKKLQSETMEYYNDGDATPRPLRVANIDEWAERSPYIPRRKSSNNDVVVQTASMVDLSRPSKVHQSGKVSRDRYLQKARLPTDGCDPVSGTITGFAPSKLTTDQYLDSHPGEHCTIFLFLTDLGYGDHTQPFHSPAVVAFSIECSPPWPFLRALLDVNQRTQTFRLPPSAIQIAVADPRHHHVPAVCCRLALLHRLLRTTPSVDDDDLL